MSSANTENLQADVVIVGAGGAGLAAAVTATEKGASVTVLEKRGGPGGNSAMAEGLFAAESPAQKRAMIDARRDDLFKTAMNYAHWKIDPRIVRAFIDKSGDTIAWLEEKGLNLDWIPALYPNQVPRVWHVPRGSSGEKRGGGEVIRVLAEKCKDLGVQLFYRTPAKKILTMKKGNVTGVLAAAEGREFRITTKSIIIATGGYGGNKELLKKYYPSYHDNMYCEGFHHTHMGDGLLMAIEIGAATEGLGILLLHGPGIQKSTRLTAVVQEPETLWVNKKGQRFTDEGITFYMSDCGHAVDRQPDKISYTLFDAKIKQMIIEQGLIKGMGVLFLPQRSKLPELERALQVGADNGRVKISNSWNEIANWIGADPKVLRATINEYNAACAQGYDPIFTKDRRYLLPLLTVPYYAIRGHLGFLDTIGGIKVNEHMEVIDNQDNPIPGLFAAGVDTGGWESDTYCTMLSGSAFGFAINSGRIAGENAVKHFRQIR